MNIKLAIFSGLMLAVSACAAPQENKTPLYRDQSGAQRGDDALRRDEAACSYEMRVMAYNRPYTPAPPMGYYGDPGMAAGMNSIGRALMNPPPGDGMYLSCMAARGWQLVGYE